MSTKKDWQKVLNNWSNALYNINQWYSVETLKYSYLGIDIWRFDNTAQIEFVIHNDF